MATEQELIDSINALPETQAFYASAGAVSNLPGDNGTIKTYNWIYTVGDKEARQRTIQFYITEDGSRAFFYKTSDPTESRPEPRVTEAQVKAYNDGVYAEAVNVSTSRLDESADRVTFDLPDDSGSFKSKEAIVRYTEGGGVRDVLIRDQISTV
jgi:hypothetical protein